MSFQLTITIRAGNVSVTHDGILPEGSFQVTGHEDSSDRQLAVYRRGPDGRYVQAAHSTHYPES